MSAPEPEVASVGSRGRSWKAMNTRWSRLVHVYTSMISLLLVLFFGITGITLNHPDWAFGSEPSTTLVEGVLPPAAASGGEFEFLAVSEFLRNEHGVQGQVKNFGEVDGEGSITFKNPGYLADVFFDTSSGDFELTEVQQGWLTVVNELHKGRDGDSAWRWVIDVSGGLLVAISLTGLYLQLFLRKRRRAAVVTAVVGTIISVVLMWMAIS